MRSIVVLLLLLSSNVFADRIVLKNGKEYRGTLLDGNGRQVKFRTTNRKVLTFRAADIERVEVGGKPAPAIRSMEADRGTSGPAPAASSTPAPEQRSEPPAPKPFMTAPVASTGPVTLVAGSDAVDSEYTRMGSEPGALGRPRGPHQPTADGRATVRFYDRGAIYWTSDHGAHAILGPILQAWLNDGGEHSRLGFPTTDEEVSEAGFVHRQGFGGGTMTWNQKNGASIQYGAR